MRYPRDGAGETGSHPFRSMFDLMLVVVFLLAALLYPQIAPGQVGKGGAAVNSMAVEQEMLTLHNIQRRFVDKAGARAPLYQSISELPAGDPCTRILARGEPDTLGAYRDLQKHRGEMWAALEKPIEHELLAEKLERVTYRTLRFESARWVPTNADGADQIIRETYRRWARASPRPRRVRIEGHTDVDQPQSGFMSNWELSARRAIWLAERMEHYFYGTMHRSTTGPDAVVIEAIGYGEKMPEALPANTPENKAKNRRIVVVLEK